MSIMYKQSGLCGATSHKPRHRSILILANKCVGVRVPGKFVGHASVAVT